MLNIFQKTLLCLYIIYTFIVRYFGIFHFYIFSPPRQWLHQKPTHGEYYSGERLQGGRNDSEPHRPSTALCTAHLHRYLFCGGPPLIRGGLRLCRARPLRPGALGGAAFRRVLTEGVSMAPLAPRNHSPKGSQQIEKHFLENCSKGNLSFEGVLRAQGSSAHAEIIGK